MIKEPDESADHEPNDRESDADSTPRPSPDFVRLGGIAGLDFAKITGATDFARFGGIDLGKIAEYTNFARLGGINLGKIAGLDFAKITGATNFARFGGIDLGKIAEYTNSARLGGIDLGKIVGAVDFARFGGIDLGKLVSDLDLDLDRLNPPNWPADVDLNLVTQVINDDGIPLVWVPRREVVELVLAAPDRRARISVLLDYDSELAEDCHLVLADINEPSLTGQLPLAKCAVEAFASGHREAAQALATVVTETVVAAAVSHRYDEVKKFVQFDPDKVPWNRLRLAAALGPIYRFYTPWWASSGAPSPEELSRHVSVHNADVGHYSPGNALVAILLVTSVLRGIQELQEGASNEAS